MGKLAYYAGTLTVVPVKGQKEPRVLLWACHRGFLLDLNEEQIDQVMEDMEDQPRYIQWLEYWSPDKEELTDDLI